MDSGSSSSARVSEIGDIGLIETYYHLQMLGPSAVLEWCQHYGLIAREYICPVCQMPMKLAPRADLADKYNWSCRGNYTTHYVKRSIRVGSLFDESNLKIPKTLLLMFMWCAKLPSSFISDQLDIEHGTVAFWAGLCREFCLKHLNLEVGKIGGKGIVVEINEDEFVSRQRNRKRSVSQIDEDETDMSEPQKRRKEVVRRKWIIAGLQKNSDNSFLAVMTEHNSENLLRILQEHVLPETTVVSSCWSAYGGKRIIKPLLQSANYNLHIKNGDKRASTNLFKPIWDDLRFHLSTRTAKDQFDSYLAEYSWRRLYKNTKERMANLLQNIKTYHPPRSQDDEHQILKNCKKKRKQNDER